MAELYEKSPDDIRKSVALGGSPEQEDTSTQIEEITGDKEIDAYLASLPPDERVSAYKRITAPLTGKELVNKVHESMYEYQPTIEEFDKVYAHNKETETFTLEGAGAIADGIGSIMNEVADTIGSSFDGGFDSRKIMPTVIEAGARGTHNTYGMFTQSENPDGILFGLKDILTGSGTRESRYNQYLAALRYKREAELLRTGKTHLVFDKKLTNEKWVSTGSLVLDPLLFAGGLGKALGVGNLAGKAMQATGLAYAGAMVGETANAIKFGVLGGSLKLTGNSLEFLGGAVRNTVDFGIERTGAGLEGLTGLSAKEFNIGLKSAGIGTTVADIAGHGVPYGSVISEVYLGSGAARGIGEAMSATGSTIMRRKKYGRGINSWAAETMATTAGLSKEAKAILNVVNAVDPMFTYSSAVIGGARSGAVFGAGLGYADNKTEGMYAGIGAGIALGGMGGLGGKMIGDVAGNTGKLRREIQANMVMEGLKEIDPTKHQALEAYKFSAKQKGHDVDFVNSVIVGLDKFAPDIEIAALSPAQFRVYAEKAGYDPVTTRFTEQSTLQGNLSMLNDMSREGRANALSILRDNGFEYAGDRAGFLDALKTRDSYKDISRRFDKLSDYHKEVILKQLDNHSEMINNKTFTKTEIRQHYNNIQWAETRTDIINDYHGQGTDPMGVKKAKETIERTLKEETGADGKLTTRGELLKDKLRTDGYLDKNGVLLDIKDSHNFDMSLGSFSSANGIVLEKGLNGKVKMYLNLDNMQNDTFGHELFHTAMRNSIHAREFLDRFTSALHGKYDKAGKLVSRPEVSEGETLKFLEKYLSARYAKNGILGAEYISNLESIKKALAENKKGIRTNIDAWKVLEHYSEEFGAYYFSEWLNGRNRNFLFRGGNLTGIEGLVERAKDGWLYYWQDKLGNANPQMDFGTGGIAGAFSRSGKLGRIKTIDMMMTDFVRATSASNVDKAFNPETMSQGALGSLIENSGVRGVASVNPRTGKVEVLDRAQAEAENKIAGKAAYNILNTLDPNLRTSVTDGDGNITGRLSKNEFDALVRAGIVNQAWVDKHLQLYNIVDGKESNTIQFGYLGKTEQTTDASQPRNRGKDVTFKQRQAIVLGVTTKIGKDGKFYTIFETLDRKVISTRQNNLWSNPECQNLWEGNRTLMEADFFRYLENASKPASDPSRIESGVFLDKGDGLGGKRRDYLHQMLGMAKTDDAPYNNKPLSEIPQGIRHSVTSFNVDGVVGSVRIDNSQRVNYNHPNAFRDLSHNWSPMDSSVETTPAGDILSHISGYKFIENKDGSVKAFDQIGNSIGTFKNKAEAFRQGGNNYNKVYGEANINKVNADFKQGQDNLKKSFQPALTEEEVQIARTTGSVFDVPRVQQFVDGTKLIKQTRDEFIVQKLDELLADGNELAFDKAVQDAVINFKPFKDKEGQLDAQLKDIDMQIRKVKEARETEVNEILTSHQYDGIDTYPLVMEVANKYDNQRRALEFQERELVRLVNDAQTEFTYNGQQLFELIQKKGKPKPDALPEIVLDAQPSAKEMVANLRKAPELFQEYKEGAVNDRQKLSTELSLRDWARECVKMYKKEMGDRSWGSQIQYEKATYIRPIFDIVSHLYDKQFNTGEPVTIMATHGTKSPKLATEMIFDAGQLGSNFALESSRSGAWFAGGQETATSGAYAGQKTLHSGNPLDLKSEKRMSVRGLIKMNNPLVVEWNGSYRESKQTKLIADAKAKGHDGIIYKRIIDGGLMEDNNYIVFNNNKNQSLDVGGRAILEKQGNIHENILLLDSNIKKVKDANGNPVLDEHNITQVEATSESMPRGVDENGNPIKNGRDLGLYYSPKEEGNRKYSKSDFIGKFIGRIAGQNKHLTNNLKINADYDPVNDGKLNAMYVNLKRIDGEDVGNISIHIDEKAKSAMVYHSDIERDYQGRGYGTLLYSEAIERLRSMGITLLKGEQVDREGRPAMIRKTVAGKNETQVSNSGLLRTKLIKGRYYSPSEEGGRVYSDKDFFGGFIGKVASKNPKLISGLKIDFIDKNSGNGISKTATKNELNITTANGREVGSIQGRSFIDSNGKENIRDVEVAVAYDKRGQGYGKLLYSEFLERMRNKGIKVVEGMVSNSEGVPVKLRNQVAGKGNTTLLAEPQYKGEGALPATIKNFKELRQENLETGKASGVPTFTELEKNAYYSPKEEGNGKANKEILSIWEQEMLAKMQAGLNRKHPDLKKDKGDIRLISSEEFIGTQIHEAPDSNQKMNSYKVQFQDGFADTRFELEILEKGNDRVIGSVSGYKNGKDITSISSYVNTNMRGKGWGSILYSELFQRANIAGFKSIKGGVINDKGAPIAIRNKVAGEGSTFMKDYDLGDYVPATVEGFLETKKHRETVEVYTILKQDAWYSPKENSFVTPDNKSIFDEAIKTKRVVFVNNFGDLQSEGALMTAHTPDSATVGKITYKGKTVADMQGGLLYTVINGERIWANNKKGENASELSSLINYHLSNARNIKDGKGNAYIVLIKGQTEKIFNAMDGAKGLVNVFGELSNAGVMPKKLVKQYLIETAGIYVDMTGFENKTLEQVVKKVNDSINNNGTEIGTMEKRKDFSASLINKITQSELLQSKLKMKKLETILGQKIKGGFTDLEANRVLSSLFEEEFLKNVPVGHAYGAIKITSPVKDLRPSNHRSYDSSVAHGETPHQLILFNDTHHITDLVNIGFENPSKKQIKQADMINAETGLGVQPETSFDKPIIPHSKAQGSYIGYTGGAQNPLSQVVSKQKFAPTMHNWKSEQASNGQIIRSDTNYKIIEQKDGTYKVYNPSNSAVKFQGATTFKTISIAKEVVDKVIIK